MRNWEYLIDVLTIISLEGLRKITGNSVALSSVSTGTQTEHVDITRLQHYDSICQRKLSALQHQSSVSVFSRQTPNNRKLFCIWQGHKDIAQFPLWKQTSPSFLQPAASVSLTLHFLRATVFFVSPWPIKLLSFLCSCPIYKALPEQLCKTIHLLTFRFLSLRLCDWNEICQGEVEVTFSETFQICLQFFRFISRCCHQRDYIASKCMILGK